MSTGGGTVLPPGASCPRIPWIDSFPISAYVSDALGHCHSPDQAKSSSETPLKEEGIKIRKVDTDDRRCISDELDKCSHPLEIESESLPAGFHANLSSPVKTMWN